MVNIKNFNTEIDAYINKLGTYGIWEKEIWVLEDLRKQLIETYQNVALQKEAKQARRIIEALWRTLIPKLKAWDRKIADWEKLHERDLEDKWRSKSDKFFDKSAGVVEILKDTVSDLIEITFLYYPVTFNNLLQNKTLSIYFNPISLKHGSWIRDGYRADAARILSYFKDVELGRKILPYLIEKIHLTGGKSVKMIPIFEVLAKKYEFNYPPADLPAFYQALVIGFSFNQDIEALRKAIKEKSRVNQEELRIIERELTLLLNK